MIIVVKGAADVAVVAVDDCDVPAVTKYTICKVI